MPLLSEIKVQDLDGYREAMDAEQSIRSSAFNGNLEFILKVPVLPLHSQHVLWLREIKSPYLSRASEPTPEDTLKLLWLVSPEFTAALAVLDDLEALQPRKARRIFRRAHRRFFRKWKRAAYARVNMIGGVQFYPLRYAINEYLDLAYLDCPTPVNDQAWTPAYYATTTGTVATIASEFHWSERDILRCPLKRLFQYYRWITRKHTGESFPNPSDTQRRIALQKLVEQEEQAQCQLEAKKPN